MDLVSSLLILSAPGPIVASPIHVFIKYFISVGDACIISLMNSDPLMSSSVLLKVETEEKQFTI